MRIVGMCVNDGHCYRDKGLMPYTTYWADLLAAEPPLSPPQMRAEKALLATAFWEFWVREAGKNGIRDTRPLEDEWRSAQYDLDAIFGDANSRN